MLNIKGNAIEVRHNGKTFIRNSSQIKPYKTIARPPYTSHQSYDSDDDDLPNTAVYDLPATQTHPRTLSLIGRNNASRPNSDT